MASILRTISAENGDRSAGPSWIEKALATTADLAACELERDEWRKMLIEANDKTEEAEAALRSDGYKRDIALERAEKAETERDALREELDDYREYYEVHHGGSSPSIEGFTYLVARIEARRAAEGKKG